MSGLFTFLQDGHYGAFSGGIIGGILSGVAAILVAYYTLRRAAHDLLDGKKWEREEHHEAVKNNLYMEAQENFDLTDKWRQFERKAPLSMEAWITYRGSISFLPQLLQQLLLNAYNQARIFNDLLNYELATASVNDANPGGAGVIGFGGNTVYKKVSVGTIEIQASETKGAFQMLMEEFDKYLGKDKEKMQIAIKRLEETINNFEARIKREEKEEKKNKK